jgi:hypothetical protein
VSLRLLEQYRWIFFFNTFGTPSLRTPSFIQQIRPRRYHRSRRNATTTRWAIIINPRILIRRRCGLVALARVVVCFRNCHFYYCVENRFRWYKFSIDVASSQDEESHCNRRRRRIHPINYLFHTSDDDYEIEQ